MQDRVQKTLWIRLSWCLLPVQLCLLSRRHLWWMLARSSTRTWGTWSCPSCPLTAVRWTLATGLSLWARWCRIWVVQVASGGLGVRCCGQNICSMGDIDATPKVAPEGVVSCCWRAARPSSRCTAWWEGEGDRKRKRKGEGKGKGDWPGTAKGHDFARPRLPPRHPLMVMLPKGARMRRRWPQRQGQSMSPLARMKNRKWTQGFIGVTGQRLHLLPFNRCGALHQKLHLLRMQPGGKASSWWHWHNMGLKKKRTSRWWRRGITSRWTSWWTSTCRVNPAMCPGRPSAQPLFGTVCYMTSCGKLQCASRIFRHEAFTPCPCEPLQRGKIGTIPWTTVASLWAEGPVLSAPGDSCFGQTGQAGARLAQCTCE